MAKDKKQFRVGNGPDDDFSPEFIELLVLKIRDWYVSDECDRSYDDPLEEAKAHVQQCLLAQTKDGSPWRACPDDFDKRIKAKCLYDMASGTGYRAPRAKSPLAVRKLDKKAKEQAKVVGQITGVDFDQEVFRKEKEVAIFSAFPELDNEAHAPIVRRLSFLYAQQEYVDRKLSQAGVSDNKREEGIRLAQVIGKDVETTLQLLGIHPNQLRQSMSSKTSGAVSELVSMLETDDEFVERTKIWAMQLALQLFYMSNHYNGRRDGPQVEDWEIWHMTRSRPMKFKCRCGEEWTLVEGFTPAELREYLIKRGVIVTEPAIPGLVPEEAIKDLDTADLGDVAHTHLETTSEPVDLNTLELIDKFMKEE